MSASFLHKRSVRQISRLSSISTLLVLLFSIVPSSLAYQNMTVTSACIDTAFIYAPYFGTDVDPYVIEPGNSTLVYLSNGPDDGPLTLKLTTEENQDASHRLDIIYLLAWGAFAYDVEVSEGGFQAGDVRLASTKKECPGVVVVTKEGVVTWTGGTGTSKGNSCSRDEAGLVLDLCI